MVRHEAYPQYQLEEQDMSKGEQRTACSYSVLEKYGLHNAERVVSCEVFDNDDSPMSRRKVFACRHPLEAVHSCVLRSDRVDRCSLDRIRAKGSIELNLLERRRRTKDILLRGKYLFSVTGRIEMKTRVRLNVACIDVFRMEYGSDRINLSHVCRED